VLNISVRKQTNMGSNPVQAKTFYKAIVNTLIITSHTKRRIFPTVEWNTWVTKERKTIFEYWLEKSKSSLRGLPGS